jgi:hypothetical protein
MRGETWESWFLGLLSGGVVAALVLAGPFMFIGLAFLALAFVAARGLAFVSGAFIGLGTGWFLAIALLFDSQGPAVPTFLGLAVMIAVIGIGAGVLAWRRRAGQFRSQAGS